MQRFQALVKFPPQFILSRIVLDRFHGVTDLVFVVQIGYEVSSFSVIFVHVSGMVLVQNFRKFLKSDFLLVDLVKAKREVGDELRL